ncbi:hypothetical protein ANCCAN_00575 [Ancylostoma caninum]|uniref:Uncharacterized protein n=1 Tax=Ancylostoma caninum TaxID=29170 RepID=A0A368HCI8_ANCCA|nr:hypothetical protein ANCCAN_00575 [Ancylostoma caninum]
MRPNSSISGNRRAEWLSKRSRRIKTEPISTAESSLNRLITESCGTIPVAT